MKKIIKLILTIPLITTPLFCLSCKSKYRLWDDTEKKNRIDYLNRIEKKVKELYGDKELNIAQKIYNDEMKKAKMKKDSDNEIKNKKWNEPWEFDDNELSDTLIIKKYKHLGEIAKKQWEKKWKIPLMTIKDMKEGIMKKLRTLHEQIGKNNKEKKSSEKETDEILYWQKKLKEIIEIEKAIKIPNFNNISYLQDYFGESD